MPARRAVLAATVCTILVLSQLQPAATFAERRSKRSWLHLAMRQHGRSTTPLCRRSSTSLSSSCEHHNVTTNQHIVLVGGGHAHVQVIKALHANARPDHWKVTLIDAQASAWYSGMVPGCVANVYTPHETQIHLAPLAQWADVGFVQDKVTDLDLDRKIVYTQNGNGHGVPFDVISLDIGSTSRDLDRTPGARQHVVPTRPIDQLVRRLEAARHNMIDTPNLVVIGGGVAGIELSMAITARWRARWPDMRCTILDAGDTLVPDESPRARDQLQAILRSKRITVRHDCQVRRVSAGRVHLADPPEMVPFTHCVWATGAGAHDLSFHLGHKRSLALSKHGWIQVNANLQSISHPFVFAAGDCAEVLGLDTASPPKAGVYAVRAGPVLIQNLPAFLQQQQQPLQEYQPQDDFLKLLVCGDGTAIAFRFGLAMHGKWVFDMKNHIDRGFLDLFDVSKLPPPSEAPDEYDTSQYDARDVTKSAPERASPERAADLLTRDNDDSVDFQEAWSVLRAMAADTAYREAVLARACTAHDAVVR